MAGSQLDEGGRFNSEVKEGIVLWVESLPELH